MGPFFFFSHPFLSLSLSFSAVSRSLWPQIKPINIYILPHWCANQINCNRKIAMLVTFDLSDIWSTVNTKSQTHTHKQTTNVMEIFSKLIDIWVHYTGRNFTWPRSLIKCLGIVGTQTGNNSSYRIRTDQLKWYDIMCTLTHNRVCINFTKFDSASVCYIFFICTLNMLNIFENENGMWDVYYICVERIRASTTIVKTFLVHDLWIDDLMRYWLFTEILTMFFLTPKKN